MSTSTTVCPFSGAECRQCAVFRGRHLELCSVSNYRLKGANGTRRKVWCSEVFTKWEMPEIPDGTNIMVDIEDFIERRGK